MEAKTLEKFGLTEGEARVYFSLMKLGKSTIGNIIKEGRVSNSKVYDILDRLNKKGLVGVVVENNRKSFEAKSPEILKDSILEQEKEVENKKKELNNILPSLKGIFESHEVKQEAEILRGVKGIKSFDERILANRSKGEMIYILGSSKQVAEMLDAYHLDWQKRRIKKGIKLRILYNSDAREFAKTREKLSLTEVKFLPNNIISPVTIDISGNEVGTIVSGENPFCFSIKNSEVANNYRNYFGLLWKISRKS